MKFSQLVLCSLATLTALSLSRTNAEAHNPVKYTGVPFVVAGNCSNTISTAQWITQGGKLALKVTNGDFTNISGAGWEVFTSFPGVNPGNITPSATTTAPFAIYGFTIAGLTGTNDLLWCSVDTTGNTVCDDVPVSNGQVSVTAPTPASGPVAVNFWIYSTPNNSNTLSAPYTVTNFTINNMPVNIDTTHFDFNTYAAFSWCETF